MTALVVAGVAGFDGLFARGDSPAEIGTGTVASPAFSKLKVKLYVRPLVIGLDSVIFASAASAASTLSSGVVCPSGAPTTSAPPAGRVVSPVSVTVPMSEVIDTSLSAASGESLTAWNSSSTSRPGWT